MASLSVIESASAIGCCSEIASSSSSSSEDVKESGNNNTLYHNQMDMDSPFPKRDSVNISFRNLKYTVNKFNFSKKRFERKELLKSINGEFEGGKLTAIMGPSGAGKSTLLNCLAGYVESGISGTIRVNGKLRSVNTFRKSSAYIHQDDALRPWLITHEAMMVAAHLKLGFNVSHEHKTKLVKQILVLLGLDQHILTLTSKLSGGQKKRLAIALELISNPPVLFLDEPTTGLDSSSCAQCVSLLKRLAQEGRTVICTIHQPSALLFEMFDNLYCLSQGFCIYQGVVSDLVPFLADQGHNCPSYHNPADFMIEVASGEYDPDMTKLSKAAMRKYEKSNLNRIKDSKNNDIEMIDLTAKKYQFEEAIETPLPKNTRANLLMQFLLLFQRHLICMKRNYKILFTRLIAHAVIGSIFGYLYLNVGALATTVLGNYVYMYGSMLLVVYTGKMSVMMSFPIEMEMMKREHFNRWYNLVPYFLSVVTFEIPFQVLCCVTYLTISYWLTGNFHENWRFNYFMLLSILSTLCAQSWGFFTGSALPVKIAVFVGPVFAVLLSVFGFCNRYVDINVMFRWMWHFSYFRVGFHGILNTVYGMGHEDLICPEKEMYCHFKTPKLFLNDMMIADVSMLGSVMMLSSVIIVMHFMTLFTLWFKLNRR